MKKQKRQLPVISTVVILILFVGESSPSTDVLQERLSIQSPWLDKGQRILQKLNLPLKFTDLTIDRRIILYNKICENTGNIKSIRAWCDWGTRVQEGHKTLLASFRENFVEGNEFTLLA